MLAHRKDRFYYLINLNTNLMKNLKWLAMASMIVLMIWGCSEEDVVIKVNKEENSKGLKLENIRIKVEGWYAKFCFFPRV